MQKKAHAFLLVLGMALGIFVFSCSPSKAEFWDLVTELAAKSGTELPKAPESSIQPPGVLIVDDDGHCEMSPRTPLLSESHLRMAQGELTGLFVWSGASIVIALNQRHLGLSGTMSSITEENGRAEDGRMKAKFLAKANLANIQRLLMAKLACCPEPVGYSLQRSAEIESETLAYMSLEDREIGMGIRENRAEWDIENGGRASPFLTPFPASGTFSQKEFESWNRILAVMIPDIQPKRPTKIPDAGAGARHRVAEQKAAQMRAIISRPWREWGLVHAPTISADDIIAWMGAYLSRPVGYRQTEVQGSEEETRISANGQEPGVREEGVHNMPSFGGDPDMPKVGDTVGELQTSKTQYLKKKDWYPKIAHWANVYGIRPELLEMVVHLESSGRPKLDEGGCCKGLVQLHTNTIPKLSGMPASVFDGSPSDPRFDVDFSLKHGAKYMRSLIDEFHNEFVALGAYNWGPGNVKAYLKNGKGFYGQALPKETIDHVRKAFGIPFNALLEGRTDIPKDVQLPKPAPSVDPKTGVETAGTHLSADPEKGVTPHVLTQAEYDRIMEITPAIGPGSEISRETMFRLIGERFISQAYQDKIASLDFDAAARELLVLRGFRYLVLREIEKAASYNSLLRSLLGIRDFESAGNATRTIPVSGSAAAEGGKK